MIGVERTPASWRWRCQAGCSSTVVPQATWWTVPALWIPRSGGEESYEIVEPRRSPRSSQVSSPAGRAPSPRSSSRAGVLEERQLGPGLAGLAGVEEVVDGRVVLVDGLGDQPQSHDPGVEVDVARGVAGDGGDVVDALELHRPSPYGIASSSQAGLRLLSASWTWMVGHEPGDRAPPRPAAPATLGAGAPAGGPLAPGRAGMHPGAVRVPRPVPAGPERLCEQLLRGRGSQHAA